MARQVTSISAAIRLDTRGRATRALTVRFARPRSADTFVNDRPIRGWHVLLSIIALALVAAIAHALDAYARGDMTALAGSLAAAFIVSAVQLLAVAIDV